MSATEQKDKSRFVRRLRCGASVFAKGFKKRVVAPAFALFSWLYRINYITGIKTIGLAQRCARWLSALLVPLWQGAKRLGNKLFGRYLRSIGAEWVRFRKGCSAARTQLRTSFADGFWRGLRCAFSLPPRAVRRHKKALGAFVSVTAPLVAAVVLVITVAYWSSLTFALELVVGGRSIGYISDETVYNNATAALADRVISTGDSFVFERAPKLSVAVVPKAEILDEEALRDKLMSAMSDTISAGAGLYVDDVFVGAVEDRLNLNHLILNTLAAHRDGSGEDIASFVEDLQIREGLFPTDSFIPMSTIEGYIKQLDVQVTRLITYEEEIAFPKRTVKDKSKYLGYSHVRTKGVKGVITHTAQVVYLNGEKIEQTLLSSEVTKNPTEQVTVIGAMTYSDGATLGDGKATGKLIWPVPYTKHVTSPYGSRWGSFHYGIDVSASGINGKALLACDGGTVIKANGTDKWGGGWGYYVLIDHGNGYQTRYAHCGKVVVKVGQKVAQGELIAYVGNTGNSTGPHLHMEVLLNGKRVDPLPYFKASGTYK